MDVRTLLAYALRKAAGKIDHGQSVVGLRPRLCPICGYNGNCSPYGRTARPDAMCPNCHSVERHRQLKLLFDHGNLLPANPRLLHFAPEHAVSQFVRPLCSEYVTADLFRDDVDLKLNIEAIDLA